MNPSGRFWRKDAKSRRATVETPRSQTSDIDAILTNIEREPLPDWVLEQEETAELVGATLSSLPPEYREALVGKYVDGLSVAQLGERVGKSEKAAESALHRARLAFSKVFQVIGKERGEID